MAITVAERLWLFTLILSLNFSNSWLLHSTLSHRTRQQVPFTPFLHTISQLKSTGADTIGIGYDDLMEMDVVVFSEKNDTSKRQLGAIQDDGRVTPMCVWTTEPAFAESLEFLVDEEDLRPGFILDQIVIHSIVPQDALSYGSRQVGGGMGPGNPHGEESELLYYIDQSILQGIEFAVKPELEIFW
jgi:hypothetical protein